MAKQKRQNPKAIRNRRARFDYQLGDSLVVGLELTGREVRSLRSGRGYLRGAYVTAKDNELWLINATISGGAGILMSEGEQIRSRRLLAKRREIDQLIASKQQGMTIVPLEILTGSRYIKLRLAVGKGMKKYDKRQLLKTREQQRQMENTIKRIRAT